MQYLALTTALLAAVSSVSASPLSKRDDTFYEVGLAFYTEQVNGVPVSEPSPVQMNKLAVTPDLTAYEIHFDGSSSNVDINKVECRAYKDAAGVVPGSAPFTLASPALLATPNNPVVVGSVLCYVTEGKQFLKSVDEE
jgi:hypothetical protein